MRKFMSTAARATAAPARLVAAASRLDCVHRGGVVLFALLTALAADFANADVIIGAANVGDCLPFGCSNGGDNQYEQVYSSSVFSAPITIDSLTFYNTVGSAPFGYDLGGGTFNIYLAYTSATVGGLSTNLSANIGADETLVYSGPPPADSQNSLGGHFIFNSSQDFNYNPSYGNLLMITTQTAVVGSGIALDAEYPSADSSRAMSSFADDDALVTGFGTSATPIPLPSSAWLMLLGLGGLRSVARCARRSFY
jgi:hypothetical protein